MDKKRMEVKKTQKRQLLGLANEGEIILTCKKCDTDLLCVMITYGNDKIIADGGSAITTMIQAECKMCGGSSPKKAVDGIFHLGIVSDDMFMDHKDSDDGVVRLVVDRRK